ncbi:Lysophospholipase, alpha-beta hydrolase superfamily [Propionibacterium cyclohexanicum]|uniref:Lysophospholipase, alpha-beta hydrolase superfamily n=1 Tax=Propionibacterium cyclohexanicum TaxID=64702 RepID=A0A1H9T6V3_9ACTN|nr:alpha/beta hydrolase [Propionibacterium cyclohexanicum]SER92878.1 Lysophospholipase, alpha-beta hydrolase superfamily [Propionibacterium cyclohexanicum]
MHAWSPDTLLAGHVATSWSIDGAAHVEGEPDLPLTATLVRRGEPRHGRAVLYLHGWNDYFFQDHVSAWFDAHGFDFYALDLRRYGRNLRAGLVAGYVADLREYESELDAAVALIHEDHAGVPITFAGHSTGGLVGSLWASERPGLLAGLILNSPWLDMQGFPLLWRVMFPVSHAVAAINPLAELAASLDTGFYRSSLHASLDGEWNWDLGLKSTPAFVPRWGWGRAILAGQAKVARGLHIDTPVLVLTSQESNFSRTWSEDMHGQDLVLDVDRICAAAVNLGNHVSIRRIKGGVHDLVLSREPVRAVLFDEIDRWLEAYVRPEQSIERYRDELGSETIAGHR